MSDRQRVTIAIALSALKFKPPEQSASLYALDILKNFSTSSHAADHLLAAHDRAIDLERRLMELQRKHDADRTELLALRATCDPISAKKKNRKKARVSEDRGRIDLDFMAILNECPAAVDSLTMPENSLFSVFNSLQQLVEQSDGQRLPSIFLLIRTIHRAIDAVSAILRLTLPPMPPPSNWREILKAVSSLTTYLLTVVSPFLLANVRAKKKPTLTTATAITDFFGLVATSIFCPVVGAFAPASCSWVSRLFSNGKHDQGGDTASDIRPHLLSLVQSGILTLDAQPDDLLLSCARNLKERLVLEAVRELEQFDSRSAGETQHSEAERQILALAQKDALWYLVNTIHAVIRPNGKPTSQPLPDLGGGVTTRGHLLRDTILISLSGLLTKVSGTGSMVKSDVMRNEEFGGNDEVGRGMILAAVEEYWMFW